MTIRYSACALLVAGCVVNGKAYGPTSSLATSSSSPTSSSSSPTSTGSSDAMTASDRSATEAASLTNAGSSAAANDKATRSETAAYPDAPADPWAAVSGDQPKRRPAGDQWTVRTHDFACTAAHDHCLETDAWFIVDQQPRPAGYQRDGEVYVLGADEPFGAWNAVMRKHGPDRYIAYRTVPATRDNLAAGALVFGFKSAHPANGRKAVEDSWAHGKLASVDLAHGSYTLEGREQPLPLSGARVAVLRWQPGGKVEIIGGKQRDQLAVRAGDVFLPSTK